jgi:hypothetical protein
MSQKKGEVEYVEEELLRLGYKAAIFSFDHVPDRKLGSDIEPPVSKVIVQNTESGTQKVYSTGGAESWSAQFLDDVHAGVFGSAPKGLDDPVRNVAIIGVKTA